MASIWQKLSAFAQLAPEITKTVSDAEQLIADVTIIENDPAIQQAIAANPTLAASVARVSAEIRTVENDVNTLKATLNTLLR